MIFTYLYKNTKQCQCKDIKQCKWMTKKIFSKMSSNTERKCKDLEEYTST